jgi:uncharacterized protein YjbI with pentapeptide repeats
VNDGSCGEDSCQGTAVAPEGRCLAHLTEDELASQLEKVRTGEATLDLRNVVITEVLLGKLRNGAVRKWGSGGFRGRTEAKRYPRALEPRVVDSARFDGATFVGNVDFNGLILRGDTSFVGAKFNGQTSFAATFETQVSFEGSTFVGTADFSEAHFKEPVSFAGAVFRDPLVLSGAIFAARATFHGADFHSVDLRNTEDLDGVQFHGLADFTAVRCSGDFDASRRRGSAEGDSRFDATQRPSFAQLSFRKAQVQGSVLFTGARFGAHDTVPWLVADFSAAACGDVLSLSGCCVQGRLSLDGTEVAESVHLEHASVMATASMNGMKVNGDLVLAEAFIKEDLALTDARVAGRLDLPLLTVGGRAWFIRSAFAAARDIGPLVCHDKLDLDHASFLENVRIEVAAPRVLCRKTNFRSGVYLLARWAGISLEESIFGAPSVVAGAPAKFPDLDETPVQNAALLGARPRLYSLRRANVANLSLSNIDMTACRFAQAQNLDALRLGDPVALPMTPDSVRWTSRRTVAEEHLWRREHHEGRRATGWYPPSCELPTWVNDEVVDEFSSRTPTADEIASIYRQLRKGREDSKDEPGAADFYYGEMEMRRMAVLQPARLSARLAWKTERAVLFVYWLVAGYGLRASRAFLALLVTIGVFAFALWAFGFPTSHSFMSSVLYSAQSTTGLLRTQVVPLTTAGEWLTIGLRLLGPLFFGLTLLSVRARIKR